MGKEVLAAVIVIAVLAQLPPAVLVAQMILFLLGQ